MKYGTFQCHPNHNTIKREPFDWPTIIKLSLAGAVIVIAVVFAST